MVGKIARVKLKMVISLVKLSFVFNSEITVFHRYLYNNVQYYSVLYNNALGILFTRGQHLHDGIISLRVKV